MNAFREKEIRNAIRDALMATGRFDACYLTAKESESAEDAAACEIEPIDGQANSEWDAQSSGTYYVDSRVALTVIARTDDEQVRDERVEMLLMTAINAVRGNGFGGLVFPAWSIVGNWRWLAAEPPERAIEATFSYRYEVDSWTGLNTSE